MSQSNRASALDLSTQRSTFLEEQIVELAAHIHAATYRLLMLVEEFDRSEAWADGGFRSCAHSEEKSAMPRCEPFLALPMQKTKRTC